MQNGELPRGARTSPASKAQSAASYPRLPCRSNPRGGLDAVSAFAEINLIQVKLQNFGLGKIALDLDGKQDFPHLARELALARQENLLGKLLGDRRSSLHDVAGDQVDQRRADNARGEMPQCLKN